MTTITTPIGDDEYMYLKTTTHPMTLLGTTRSPSQGFRELTYHRDSMHRFISSANAIIAIEIGGEVMQAAEELPITGSCPESSAPNAKYHRLSPPMTTKPSVSYILREPPDWGMPNIYSNHLLLM
jgi:hypothetical protein